MITKAKLDKFVKVRNENYIHTNLQFHIDAESCGFKAKDLGDAKKLEDGRYQWNTPFGILEEQGCVLSLKPKEITEKAVSN